MKKILVLFSCFLLLFVIPIYSNAQKTDNEQTQGTEMKKEDKIWEKRKKMIEKAMVEAFSKRDENEVIKKLEELGLEYLGGKTDKTSTNNSADIYLEPLSEGSMVELSYSYFRDRYSGKYLVQGAWSWTGPYYDTNSDPYDAFGLWMHKISDGTPATGQVFESQGCAVYDTHGSVIDNMWSSDFDPANAGVAWTVNDVYMTPNYYVGDYGQGWIWMTKPPSQSVYLHSKLVHTYQGGSITNISIGTSGLMFNLSSTTESWPKADFVKIDSWPQN